MKIRKVRTSVLIIGLLVGLTFSIFIGFTGIAMGLGSRFPQLNLIAKPFTCPGGQISFTQHVSEIGTATYWTAQWFCIDEQSGTKTEIDSNAVFLYAGIVYGLLLFVTLFIATNYYWNSSVGPAKNDGLLLW
jgi:hypothetical protein